MPAPRGATTIAAVHFGTTTQALVLLAALAFPLRGAEPARLPDLAGRAVVVAVEDDYPPFNYVVPATGKPGGWDYDVVRELGRRLNFRPEFREISWDSMIQGIATGQFDMAANGITVTPERQRVVDFSAPYAKVRQRLLVRSEERRFDSLDGFARASGTRIGAQKGNTNYSRAEAIVGSQRVVAYDGFGDLVQALLSGDLDAVVIDDVGGQGYVGANAGRLRLLQGELDAQDLAMVFPKGSALRGAVDAALLSMRADGSLARTSDAWFSPSFRAEEGPKR